MPPSKESEAEAVHQGRRPEGPVEHLNPIELRKKCQTKHITGGKTKEKDARSHRKIKKGGRPGTREEKEREGG